MIHLSQEQGVILGGGVAGLATALNFQQSGLDVPIIEKRSEGFLSHHLIWLAPNGIQELERLGLADRIKQIGVEQISMIFADKNLQTLMQLRGRKLKSLCSENIIAVRRCDLYSVLLESFMNRGGQIFKGVSVDKIEFEQDSVRLSVQDEVLQAKFLVGADGVYSQVRSVLNSRYKPKKQGIYALLGKTKWRHASQYIGRTIEAWGKGSRFVFTAMNDQDVYWSALSYEESPEGDRLVETFSDYHPHVNKLIQSRDPSFDKKVPFVTLHAPKQQEGPIALIGDACHAMPPNMGQGASLAMEDARHIAELWVANKNFRGLEKSRSARVRKAQFMANSMNTFFQPKSQTAAIIRNSVAKALPNRLLERSAVNFYEGGASRPSMMSSILGSRFAKLGMVYATKYLDAQSIFRLAKVDELDYIARLLTEQFVKNEPLCRTIKASSEGALLHFKELVHFAFDEDLVFVLADLNSDKIRAVMCIEDHSNPYQPLEPENVCSKMALIADLLDSLKVSPSHKKYGDVYQFNLWAIAEGADSKSVVPHLMARTIRQLESRGYKEGYAKITNPIGMRLMQNFEKKLQQRLFLMDAVLDPSTYLTSSGSQPFSRHKHRVKLIRWQRITA